MHNIIKHIQQKFVERPLLSLLISLAVYYITAALLGRYWTRILVHVISRLGIRNINPYAAACTNLAAMLLVLLVLC